jgi:hypothetical protein
MSGTPRGGASRQQREQQQTGQAEAKRRAKELEDLSVHGSEKRPMPGSQAWANQRGL